MLNSDKIKEIIRQNPSYLLWDLSLKQQYGNDVPIAFFNGELFKTEQSEESKLEQCIEALDKSLELYKDIPNQTFSIKLKRSKTSNGDKGILGPYYFTINNIAPVNGLGGLQQPQNFAGLGMVPVDVMDMRIGAITETLTAKMELLLQQQELKRKEEVLAEEKKKIEEERIKFNSAGEKAALGFSRLFESGINRWIDEGDLAGFFPKNSSLGKTDSEMEENLTESQKIIQNIAEDLDSKKLSPEELQSLHKHLENLFKAKEAQEAQEKNNKKEGE